jgi:hypothetical protein
MPQALKSTGTTFWIGTTASNGSTDSYVQIAKCKQVANWGGGAFNMQDTTTTDSTVRQTTKTLLDPVDVDLEINEIPGDAGQAALKAAFEDTADDPYNFEARFDNGTKRRIKAKVTQHNYGIGSATAIRTVRAKLEPTDAGTFA